MNKVGIPVMLHQALHIRHLNAREKEGPSSSMWSTKLIVQKLYMYSQHNHPQPSTHTHTYPIDPHPPTHH